MNLAAAEVPPPCATFPMWRSVARFCLFDFRRQRRRTGGTELRRAVVGRFHGFGKPTGVSRWPAERRVHQPGHLRHSPPGTNYTACFPRYHGRRQHLVAGSPSNLFHAVAGYDLCTGLGTPNGTTLINALAGPPDALVVSPIAGYAFQRAASARRSAPGAGASFN